MPQSRTALIKRVYRESNKLLYKENCCVYSVFFGFVLFWVWDGITEIMVSGNLYVIYKSQNISAVSENNCSAIMHANLNPVTLWD